MKLQQQQIEAFEKFKAMTDKRNQQREQNNKSESKTKTTITSGSTMKDEAAVNREIAALLLNLHANNGRSVAASNSAVPKAEDLSLKSSVETAIGESMTMTSKDDKTYYSINVSRLDQGQARDHSNSHNASLDHQAGQGTDGFFSQQHPIRECHCHQDKHIQVRIWQCLWIWIWNWQSHCWIHWIRWINFRLPLLSQPCLHDLAQPDLGNELELFAPELAPWKDATDCKLGCRGDGDRHDERNHRCLPSHATSPCSGLELASNHKHVNQCLNHVIQ